MTSDISIRTEGRAGRITLTRPKSLNALSYDMCKAIAAALYAWDNDPAVHLILIDAEGDRAFCAGGDIAAIYHQGKAGDYAEARQFWADEYRMNNRLATYAKPIVSFMHGFVMGGGVGVGCHVKHRIVGDTTRIAMPECGIGLVPDVGGTALLAAAPGHLGEYLGLTGARMDAGDAIRAGFADHYIAESAWDDLKTQLIETGDITALTATLHPAPEASLTLKQDLIDELFSADTLTALFDRLETNSSDFAADTLKSLRHHAPLAMATSMTLIRRQRPTPDLKDALTWEYRCTYRAQEQGDFLEGIRAQVIDKDRTPKWTHASPADLTQAEIDRMIEPLGVHELRF
ncbi:enoyl-CoA hydratase/isomerase family protein [Donghicola sp. C2-DW-16]|uniref:3-hydroxyisobutyryl-CoA hydrolase n=1 Tax=Donghicola mangrovi TaxID=2729614 RepID=A0ABX2PE88_9RHOB|nr:enoyl-CoA hydratase/isomerase family protein [Donghicola mangrovi]NVO26959.1 enoyl-CoA hydratase/isomerase family protein [Donghicola mangrovi]